MNDKNKGSARRMRVSAGRVKAIRVRAVVAYPAFSVALIVSVALALTPFGPAQSAAYAASPTASPTATATATATPTSSPTSTAAPSPTSSAPSPTSSTPPAPGPSVTPSPKANPSPAPAPAPSPGTPAALVKLSVDHHVLARIKAPDFRAGYLPVDAPVLDASQFQTFRVRFLLRNTGAVPITATPQLEYRPDGGGRYAVVPEKSQRAVPFSMAREWVPSPGLRGGTIQGPLSADIAVADLRIGNEPGGLTAVGRHTMGANPGRPITLAPGSHTEQEFTVRLTMDAKYLTGYQLRVTDGGAELTGTVVPTIRLGSPPPMRLSPGQRQGVRMGNAPAKIAGAAAYPLLAAGRVAGPAAVASTPAAVASTPAAVASTPAAVASTNLAGPTPRYALASGSLSPAAAAPSVQAAPAAGVGSGIHGPYSMTADQCAACHRGHSAKGGTLLATPGSQSTLCFTCHDGMGANSNVKAQYTLARPANVPAEREFYSHDAEAATTPVPHTGSGLDEFGGVSNRHSECADCHNSHKANATDSVETASGWAASGRLAGVSGVSVVNGAAGTAPTYTFLSGVNDDVIATNKVTREYQLCLKCHSGATTLTSNAGLPPSKYALDKGVEFNPANPSTHPVEAAGKNQTPMMAASLAGSSPYKLWNFTSTSTIRCLNCHAGAPTPPPAAGGALEPHTSTNRGILLRNYQDRLLKPRNGTAAAYSAGDFALCFVCHAEEPFSSDTPNTTNFAMHGFHLTSIAGTGDGGTAIDTPGAGQGNAVCAECHFRIHSTTNKSGTQSIPGTRLLNFAPNVQPRGATLSWTPDAIPGGGSCTLTCHGYPHNAKRY